MQLDTHLDEDDEDSAMVSVKKSSISSRAVVCVRHR